LPRKCLQCGYVLEHLPGNRCPECGAPFNANDPASYDADRIPFADFCKRAAFICPFVFCGFAYVQIVNASFAVWGLQAMVLIDLVRQFLGARHSRASFAWAGVYTIIAMFVEPLILLFFLK
jgi:hypothetical protein